MALSAKIYSFNFDVNISTRGVYDSLRLKTALHHDETKEHLYARLLAFQNSYVKGLEFSQGLYEPSQPTIWRKDVIDNIDYWIEIACRDGKKIKKALKQYSNLDLALYFYDWEQVHQFCHSLKGMKIDFLKNVPAYFIPSDVLIELSNMEFSNSSWIFNELGGHCYVTYEDYSFEMEFLQVDIAEHFFAEIQH